MKISIIVPIYNSSEYLNECIDSLIAQTYNDIEIILINDGSTDNSVDICQNYKSIDSRILIINKENGGLSDARNAGQKIATGEYIMFVDSDDFIDLDSCEAFANAIGNTDIDIIAGNAKRIDSKTTYIRHAYKGDIINGVDFLKHEFKNNSMNMAVCFNMFRRAFLTEHNLEFVIDIYHEDELFTPQAYLLAKSVCTIDNNFYNYIIHENSITTKSDKSKNAQDVIYICKTLDMIFKNIDDIQLKTWLYDHLVNLYLNIFQQARLYRNDYKHLVDKTIIRHKGYTTVNKARIKLFCFSPKLYYFINMLRIKLIS